MSRRIWTEAELTIAFYLAKWDNDLQISIKDLAHKVIKNTSQRSLEMQIAKFRELLNIDGEQFKDWSKLQIDLVERLHDKSRLEILELVIKSFNELALENGKVKPLIDNTKAQQSKDKLNQQYQENFKAKLLMFKRMGRKLTPINR